MTRRELEAQLGESVAALGDVEVRVLALIASRLVMGAKQYGPLDVQGDGRDWRHEAAEELLDGCVYLAAQTLREGRA